MHAKCPGKGCLIKETCRRFTDPPKEVWQSWAAFNELGECDQHRPNGRTLYSCDGCGDSFGSSVSAEFCSLECVMISRQQNKRGELK